MVTKIRERPFRSEENRCATAYPMAIDWRPISNLVNLPMGFRLIHRLLRCPSRRGRTAARASSAHNQGHCWRQRGHNLQSRCTVADGPAQAATLPRSEERPLRLVNPTARDLSGAADARRCPSRSLAAIEPDASLRSSCPKRRSRLDRPSRRYWKARQEWCRRRDDAVASCA